MGSNKYYCRINGKIENLEHIQKLIDNNQFNGEITLAMYENKIFDIVEASTFEEVIKFNNNEIPTDYNECLKRMQESNSRRVNANVPKCPTCGSTRIQKISVSKKALGVFGFGLLSKTARNQFECKKCGYKW